jgi:C4-dicarboxylate transporter, DctM subunit
MVMLIIISAKIFSRFVSLSMMPRKLILLLEPLLDYPGLILAILVAVYFILFMFLEGSAVIVMTTPILLPIILIMNIDIVWFGAFVGVAAVIGLVTPPVGMSVYAVCGTTQLKLEEVFKKTLIFAGVAGVVTGGLMIAFPQIALFLPSTMF